MCGDPEFFTPGQKGRIIKAIHANGRSGHRGVQWKAHIPGKHGVEQAGTVAGLCFITQGFLSQS